LGSGFEATPNPTGGGSGAGGADDALTSASPSLFDSWSLSSRKTARRRDADEAAEAEAAEADAAVAFDGNPTDDATVVAEATGADSLGVIGCGGGGGAGR
jgi:hypothetical protein